MDLNKIENSEVLYRVVRESNPNGFINGKPSAALFLDARGTSVERDGERDEDEIIDAFRKRFRKNDYKTSVKVTAEECRTIGTYPNPIGNKRNMYHAEVHESETEVYVSLVKAMQLATKCKVVNK